MRRALLLGGVLLPAAATAWAQANAPRPGDTAALAPVVVTATRTEAAPFDIPGHRYVTYCLNPM